MAYGCVAASSYWAAVEYQATAAASRLSFAR
jgi:hypothetical protein